MTKTLFLPGAGGSASFWKAAATLTRLESVFLAWPGLGNEPAAPGITGLKNLVAIVLHPMDEPVNLVAQSAGGLVAMKAALAAPDRVKRLVLVATSAGIPVKDLGGADWRSDYYRTYPHAAAWIGEVDEDLSDQLTSIRIPTLLLWGDRDPISPIAVGERLSSLLPNARLHVIRGGGHDLALTHAAIVANLMEQHLGA